MQRSPYKCPAIVLALTAAAVLAAKLFCSGCLIVNRTPSIPRGVYWLSRGARPAQGELVVFPIPAAVRPLFRERELVPSSFFDLLAKPVAAAGGDRICRRDDQIFINDYVATTIRGTDSRGRPMPRIDLCRVLSQHEIFVLTDSESFDSRYLGPIPTADVLGTLTPLIEF